MQRTIDPVLINSILRHPDIAPGFFREVGGPVDLPSWMVVLVGHSGIFALEPGGDFAGIHAAIKPECRGAQAVCDAKSAFNWAFCNLPINAVRARIKSERREVQHFAVASGMRRYSKTDEFTFFEVRKWH